MRRERALRNTWMLMAAVGGWVSIICFLTALIARQAAELTVILGCFALLFSLISFLVAAWLYD